LQVLVTEGCVDRVRFVRFYPLAKLSEMIAKQVFYVLFGNRKTLHKFGEMVRYYVTDAAPCFKPESYTAKGRLHRKQPPVWA